MSEQPTFLEPSSRQCRSGDISGGHMCQLDINAGRSYLRPEGRDTTNLLAPEGAPATPRPCGGSRLGCYQSSRDGRGGVPHGWAEQGLGTQQSPALLRQPLLAPCSCPPTASLKSQGPKGQPLPLGWGFMGQTTKWLLGAGTGLWGQGHASFTPNTRTEPWETPCTQQASLGRHMCAHSRIFLPKITQTARVHYPWSYALGFDHTMGLHSQGNLTVGPHIMRAWVLACAHSRISLSMDCAHSGTSAKGAVGEGLCTVGLHLP